MPSVPSSPEKHVASPGDLLEFMIQQADIRYIYGSLQQHEHGYRMRKRTLQNYNLTYVVRGRARWVYDGESIELGADECIWVPPGVPHYGESVTQRITLMSYHLTAHLPGGGDLLDMIKRPLCLSTATDSRLANMVRLSSLEYEIGRAHV